MVFPRKEFEKASCKDANVEKGLIVDMFNKIDAEKWNLHSLILVKNGAKVFDAYATGFGPNHAEDVFSISKSFTALAVGICQDLKLLKITDKVLPLFQKELNGQYLPDYEQLKIEHSQRSIPFIKIPTEDATTPFTCWKEKNDKIDY